MGATPSASLASVSEADDWPLSDTSLSESEKWPFLLLFWLWLLANFSLRDVRHDRSEEEAEEAEEAEVLRRTTEEERNDMSTPKDDRRCRSTINWFECVSEPEEEATEDEEEARW